MVFKRPYAGKDACGDEIMNYFIIIEENVSFIGQTILSIRDGGGMKLDFLNFRERFEFRIKVSQPSMPAA